MAARAECRLKKSCWCVSVRRGLLRSVPSQVQELGHTVLRLEDPDTHLERQGWRTSSWLAPQPWQRPMVIPKARTRRYRSFLGATLVFINSFVLMIEAVANDIMGYLFSLLSGKVQATLAPYIPCYQAIERRSKESDGHSILWAKRLRAASARGMNPRLSGTEGTVRSGLIRCDSGSIKGSKLPVNREMFFVAIIGSTFKHFFNIHIVFVID